MAASGVVIRAGDSAVIVGARLYGPSSVGRAFCYHGSATGLSVTADWFAPGDPGAQLGYSVATATIGTRHGEKGLIKI